MVTEDSPNGSIDDIASIARNLALDHEAVSKIIVGSKWSWHLPQNKIQTGIIELNDFNLSCSWDTYNKGTWELWRHEGEWHVLTSFPNAIPGQSIMTFNEDLTAYNCRRLSDDKEFCGDLVFYRGMDENAAELAHEEESQRLLLELQGSKWGWRSEDGNRIGALVIYISYLSCSWAPKTHWQLYFYNYHWYITTQLGGSNYLLKLASDVRTFVAERENGEVSSGFFLLQSQLLRGSASLVGLNSARKALPLLYDSKWAWADDERGYLGTVWLNEHYLATSWAGKGHWQLYVYNQEWWVLAEIENETWALRLDRNFIYFRGMAGQGNDQRGSRGFIVWVHGCVKEPPNPNFKKKLRISTPSSPNANPSRGVLSSKQGSRRGSSDKELSVAAPSSSPRQATPVSLVNKLTTPDSNLDSINSDDSSLLHFGSRTSSRGSDTLRRGSNVVVRQ